MYYCATHLYLLRANKNLIVRQRERLRGEPSCLIVPDHRILELNALFKMRYESSEGLKERVVLAKRPGSAQPGRRFKTLYVTAQAKTVWELLGLRKAITSRHSLDRAKL